MESIRTYTGPVFLCSSCGQPCYESAQATEGGALLQHFREQRDGIHCATFPLATRKIEVDWQPTSLDDLKSRYQQARPRLRVQGAAC
ncbi:hypothetical protein [Actinacidiphila bryophytorum]|uniref:Uncharacterized protein n=2 Tax=Actinacidiphila bryophytorum TaxID=1436133 RepID=A0A9W4MG95_9ACTN|nr:hypothetical protein [Actinacidiphila bryophytorum]MBM9438650.1 hypothetical protein [Actinacidiphila bryophytorum]CAG7653876.1 conserved hypothetical protein [Actinacidiphila bryophytorum]